MFDADQGLTLEMKNLNQIIALKQLISVRCKK
jgi:hypothetical protein